MYVARIKNQTTVELLCRTGPILCSLVLSDGAIGLSTQSQSFAVIYDLLKMRLKDVCCLKQGN